MRRPCGPHRSTPTQPSLWPSLALLLLAAALAAAQAPRIRTAGLHRVALDAPAARWLGPGGHPAWSPDGHELWVQAAHGLTTDAPGGPVYALDPATGRAHALGQADPVLAVRPDSSGTWLAAALVRLGRHDAGLTVLDATHGQVRVAPLPLGPATGRTPQQYAWRPGASTVLVASAAGAEGGLWEVPVPSGAAERRWAVTGADGVWPLADGSQAVVRHGQALDLVKLPSGAAQPLLAEQTGREVLDVALGTNGRGVWVTCAEKDGAWVRQFNFAGPAGASWPLAGQLGSGTSVSGGRLLYVASFADHAAVMALNLSDGATRELASIDPRVPLRPDPAWPAPAPLPAPDGQSVVVALGRTDRYGVTDRDKWETTDTDVRGQPVKCNRRGRNVGASGVVFDARQLEFVERVRPKADGPVADETRGGAFRWRRPSPPRWVVLHHTSTTSDRGSLNSLTSSYDGKISQLYADITPGAKLRAEPNTIGVHYVVLRAGTVVQLVEEQYLARHAGTGQWLNKGPIYDFNPETIGIEIVANGYDFTAGQVRSVGRLVADICRRQGIPLKHVAGESFAEGVLYHKDFAGGLRGKPDPAGWPWDTMVRHSQTYLQTGS